MNTRMNIVLDEDMLSRAQAIAAAGGVPMSVAGNKSAFVRWLLEEYVKLNEGEVGK